MNETINLDDMRLFAAAADAKSFTDAGRKLGLPKQTLSRRLARLEEQLGVQLMVRSTRRMELTEAGAAYADRCADIVRQAAEATRALTDAQTDPKGILRITADPVFGDAFVSDLAVAYATRFPDVELDVVLTRRHVNLIEEGFDIAFRVGHVAQTGLTATPLMPADVKFCGNPDYFSRYGTPSLPEDLKDHRCILVPSEGTSMRWPLRSAKAPTTLVSGPLRFTSFAMAHKAALAGLGIAIFPEFTCADDIANGRLVPVLDDYVAEIGHVSVIHPTPRYLAPRVKAFIDLTVERFRSTVS